MQTTIPGDDFSRLVGTAIRAATHDQPEGLLAIAPRAHVDAGLAVVSAASTRGVKPDDDEPPMSLAGDLYRGIMDAFEHLLPPDLRGRLPAVLYIACDLLALDQPGPPNETVMTWRQLLGFHRHLDAFRDLLAVFLDSCYLARAEA